MYVYRYTCICTPWSWLGASAQHDVFQVATGIKASAAFGGSQSWAWPRWSLMVPHVWGVDSTNKNGGMN